MRESNDAVLDFYRNRGYEEQNVRVLGKFFDSELTTLRRDSES